MSCENKEVGEVRSGAVLNLLGSPLIVGGSGLEVEILNGMRQAVCYPSRIFTVP